ncbi:MAG: hypothetical protein ACI8RD_006019, partial [Bacillariaceae sp.]
GSGRNVFRDNVDSMIFGGGLCAKMMDRLSEKR